MYYGLALLLVAIISQPSVATGILYQLETWTRMFVGQLLLSLISSTRSPPGPEVG